ncbi:17-beta-hydroxysteroid dehydrogenase type 6-like [Pollicipes pollicipes]|uniref:17-beta-hydroxysteroid dehydrogenase type 6-like n=1 Tax=Pollicipes pollicipes TaxID=41117 RepID=UPI0018855AD6|nr:17-beta-hydroxysteroid dehydrogenase type 6-like [Pollicipes pollicipes]
MFRLQTALHVGVLSATYAVLRLAAFGPWIQELAVFLLALLVTSFFIDALRQFLPRYVIDHRSDKAVFVTGCDTGFGHAVARRLDALGLRVFAGCLFPDGEGARTLQRDCSSSLTVVACDVTSQEQVAAAVVRVGALLKDTKLHAVVNNAGVFTISEVEWCSLDMYRRLFEINCLGAIRVTKAFLPLVRAHGAGGRVVIVASLAGRYTIPGLSAYSASKHATISFADGLRREMHKFNISVHTVEPSTYRTPILSESVLEGTVKKDWDAAGEEVRASYGEHYRDEFKVKFMGDTEEREAGEQDLRELHAVVNNAGVFTISEVEWCSLDMYRRLFEINCLGAIRVTKAFLPLVRAHGAGGRVVIVASLAGRYTIPGLSAYSASKHATISFADGLRREMHKFNISVHTVEPSTYRTPILSESVLEGTVKKDWDAAGEEVRASYGEHYRDEFKVKFMGELKNARPASKIYEVVDDILDATVGVEPRARYVPSAAVTLRSQLIQSLPLPVVDSMLESRACPPTPPAAVIRQRQRQLKNPYTMPQKPFLKRFFSVPHFEKPPPSPAHDDHRPPSFAEAPEQTRAEVSAESDHAPHTLSEAIAEENEE